ncbi:MAG TPA: transcriptional repressor [Candidatus Levybacteria bacterium]|nr:transcriptional repressor [Candidatus Levybacteria bacterium]
MNIKLDVKAKMKMGGHRTSATRELLIDIFQTQKSPLSVPELLELLKEKNTTVNKTTLYREVEKLVNHDILKEVYFKSDKVRYELSNAPHHHHIVCVECKRVDDISMPKDVLTQEKKIKNLLNYKVLDHSLEFFGVCKSCQ